MVKRKYHLDGRRFGRLFVSGPTHIECNQGSIAAWQCSCDCGGQVDVRTSALISGNTQSCGCLHDDSNRIVGKRRRTVEVGDKYGRLTVIAEVYRAPDGRQRQLNYECVCSCGGTTTTSATSLRTGDVVSCGCFCKERTIETSTTHGMAPRGNRDNRYGIWGGMIQRCINPSVLGYKHYGGRGIKVCDRWRFGEDGKPAFQCFAEDMGPRPSLKHSIDRWPDNDGNYEPGNCRWATAKQQANNKHRASNARQVAA